MIKGVTHARLGPIWYHSEFPDAPYSPNQFLGWDFFCRFLQQTGSREPDWLIISMLEEKIALMVQITCLLNNTLFNKQFPLPHFLSNIIDLV